MSKREIIAIALYVFGILILNWMLGGGQVNGQLLCPVQPAETVPNRTGVQCVWSSLELIGNYIEEPKLYNLTKDSRCQGLADPGRVHSLLTSKGIKFAQTKDKKEGMKIMLAAMDVGLPVLCGFSGVHAINVVNYDETANRVHYIDNIGERTPRIMSLEKFNRAWDGWIVAIYPANQTKVRRLLKQRQIEMWYYSGE